MHAGSVVGKENSRLGWWETRPPVTTQLQQHFAGVLELVHPLFSLVTITLDTHAHTLCVCARARASHTHTHTHTHAHTQQFVNNRSEKLYILSSRLQGGLSGKLVP